ncbi:MAG: serine hydrolase [Pseudomonadales bacterium]
MDRYVTEMQGSVYAGVTIRQLLTMSSGVQWNEDYTDPNSDVARAGFEMFAGEASPILGYMRRLARAQPAGQDFHYSTGRRIWPVTCCPGP